MSTWHIKVWVIRVFRVLDCDTRITRNNFGFCKLLPEIPEQNSGFGYFGFGFGYSGFGLRVTGYGFFAQPNCPVRQPCHQAVGFRPLELLTTGPPDSPVMHRTGPVHCLVRLLASALTSARAVAMFTVHCSVADDRCSAWHTGQFGATPDSPVNYSGAASPNSRRWQVWSGTPWCTRHYPVRQTRAAFGLSFALFI
jgi:hypothetical protein